jgi:hypothetical protein
MPPVAAKSKAKVLTRLELCRELLNLRRDPAFAEAFDRIEAIKTELKSIAATEGKFRETFVGIGYVSVSPATPEEVTGEKPVLVVSAWSALKPARQEKLLEDGVVKIDPIVKGAYHGRVDVKLH